MTFFSGNQLKFCFFQSHSAIGSVLFKNFYFILAYSSVGKESACNVGDLGLIPGLGRSPREGKGYLLQYSGLGNSTDRIVHGVAKSQTRLSDFHFLSLSFYKRDSRGKQDWKGG